MARHHRRDDEPHITTMNPVEVIEVAEGRKAPDTPQETTFTDSIPQVAKAIKAFVAKGDKAADKAEQYYKAAGLHLKTLKELKPDGVTWEDFVKEKCGVARSRADELIQIADGRASLDQVREKNKERQKRFEQKKKAASPPLANGHAKSDFLDEIGPVRSQKTRDDEVAEPEADQASDPQSYLAAFLLRTDLASKALIGCEGLVNEHAESAPASITKDVARAARAVATAWAALASTLEESAAPKAP
jgi:hypothetical protein